MRNLPQSLEELSLGYLRTSWTLENAIQFGQTPLPALRALNLENNGLRDEHLKALGYHLSKKLRSLKLGYNFFGPKALSDFLGQSSGQAFPSLDELDLRIARVGNSAGIQMPIPPTVTRLWLEETGLNSENFKNIRLPRSLSQLSLARNRVGNSGIKRLAPHLASDMDFLDLSATELERGGLSPLWNLAVAQGTGQGTAEGTGLRRVSELRLNQNRISDGDLEELVHVRPKVDRLFLNYNLVGDEGIKLLSKAYFKSLLALDLSGNVWTEKSLELMASSLSDQLEELHLKDNPVMSFMRLFQAPRAALFSRALRVLDVSDNLLGDLEVKALAQVLPPYLATLNLNRSSFGPAGAHSLVGKLPKGLKTLWLESVPLGGLGIQSVFEALPAGLRDLTLGHGALTRDQLTLAGQHLPQGLIHFIAETFLLKGTDLKPFLERFPRSLMNFYFLGTPISLEAARALNQKWPDNAREIKFSGKFDSQTTSALFSDSPVSLEQFVFLGEGNLEDRNFLELSSKDLRNIRLTKIHGIALKGSIHQGLLAYVKATQFSPNFQIFQGAQVSEKFFLDLPPEAFSEVRVIFMSNRNFTREGLLNFVKHCRTRLFFLMLPGLNINHSWITPFLSSLPEDLGRLQLSGNPIGEKGREKIRSFLKSREMQKGVGVEFIEE